MKNFQIVDNFLDPDDFIFLKSQIENDSFPWYYSKVISNDLSITMDERYNYQFVHIFYKDQKQNSLKFEILDKLIKKINPKYLLKIKANLTTVSHEIIEHGYHNDFTDAITCVFYLNSNNGYTKFEDGTVVSSIENRAVFFDSNFLHTGTTVTDQPYRIVININFTGY